MPDNEEELNLITEDQDPEEAIRTQRSRPSKDSPEEFYAQPDSIYIRIKWDQGVKGFTASVRNEVFSQYSPEDLPEDIFNLNAFVRGLVELGMAYPSRCYTIGVQAMNQDSIHNNEALSDSQKDLLLGEPKGSA